MRILQRYLLRQFLVASAAFLGALLLSWLTAEVLLHLDRFREDPSDAWRLTALRSLEALPLGVPIACLGGAVWTLTRSARFLELVAIRSGGIALRRVLAPILVATVLLGVGIAFLEDRLLTRVRREARELTDHVLERSEGSVSLSNDRCWIAQGSFVLAAEDYDPEPLRLQRVTVFEFDARRRIVLRIDAEEARHLGGRSWEFRDARILDLHGDAGPELRQEQVAALPLALSDRDLARALPPLEMISLHRLARWIREHEGPAARRLSLERAFHARLAQPFALPILVLFAIGFSVGHADRKDTLGRAMIRSLLAAAAFWTAWTSGLLVAGSGRVPPALPVWGVTVLFLGLGALRYRAIPE